VNRGLVTIHGAKRYGVVIDEAGEVDNQATVALRVLMMEGRAENPLFDFGGSIEEIKERCLLDTGLEPPIQPKFKKVIAD